MGAIAESFMAFAQPLFDKTDGSEEQMMEALTISQLCYNYALLPKPDQLTELPRIQSILTMNDDEFAEFRREILFPMVRRHEEMFPFLHGAVADESSEYDDDESVDDFEEQPWIRSSNPIPTVSEKVEVVDRYAPCPCNSGRKYKFCCGAKRR
jgi:uncharacterized protein YecA (UPF0149 family)